MIKYFMAKDNVAFMYEMRWSLKSMILLDPDLGIVLDAWSHEKVTLNNLPFEILCLMWMKSSNVVLIKSMEGEPHITMNPKRAEAKVWEAHFSGRYLEESQSVRSRSVKGISLKEKVLGQRGDSALKGAHRLTNNQNINLIMATKATEHRFFTLLNCLDKFCAWQKYFSSDSGIFHSLTLRQR